MPFWQPANILHSVLIFMLLRQINIVVVVVNTTPIDPSQGRSYLYTIIVTDSAHCSCIIAR